MGGAPNEGKENINSLRVMSDLNLTFDTKRYNSNLTPLSLNYHSLQNIHTLPENGEYKKDLLFIKELQDQFKFNPALSLSFALTLFSMAGIY